MTSRYCSFEGNVHKRSQFWRNVTRSGLEIFLRTADRAEQEGVLYDGKSFAGFLKVALMATSTTATVFAKEEEVPKSSFSRYYSGDVIPPTPTRKQLTNALLQKARNQLAELSA